MNGAALTIGAVAALALGARVRRGSRATTPLPDRFRVTEIGLLTRNAFLTLRNPTEKFHSDEAYDFDLAKLNRSSLFQLAQHHPRRGETWTLEAIDPQGSTGYVVTDERGPMAVLHEGVLRHTSRIRGEDVPRTWRPRRGGGNEAPIQLDIPHTQRVKSLGPFLPLVDDIFGRNRAQYPHLLQNLRVHGESLQLRAAGFPVRNKGTALALLRPNGQVVADATNEWGATLLVVAREWRGRGLGGILGQAWYERNPAFTSGGFTGGGYANAIRMWEARVRVFLDRGWYSELVKAGRMTATEVKAITSELRGPRAPSPFPTPLPAEGPAPQLLVYVDGPTFVLYDSRFLSTPNEDFLHGFGFFRDAPRVGTFLYRINYDAPWALHTITVALQLAKDEGWPVWVGPEYGDVVEWEGMPNVQEEKGHIQLTADALPLRDMARLEAKIRRRADPHREMESQLLEMAESKWD